MDNGIGKKKLVSVKESLLNYKLPKLTSNDNIDINNINNNIDNSNDINIDTGKYACKKGFAPRTEETQVAYEIATFLKDLDNYAFYRSAVQKLTPAVVQQLYSEIKDDIRRGKEKGKPIRNPAALFNWKVKRKIYNE